MFKLSVCVGGWTSFLSNKLLLKLLSSVEDVKQTQKLHSSMLQMMLKQVQTPAKNSNAKLPDSIKFPLSSQQDVDNIELNLEDPATKETLVRVEILFL